MRIDIVTILPELIQGAFTHSIMKRAIEAGHAEVHFHDPRDYTEDKHKKIDDYQFGGGAGMVMMPQPLADLLDKLKSDREYDDVIYLTPDGVQLKQSLVNKLSFAGNLIMICGHYKGIDERIREHYVTLELSIGDYVLSGGELAAAVLADAIIRVIPGAMGDGTSALTDSFQDQLLAPPVYTRPADFRGWKVPEILTSGNLKAIDVWRHDQALERTKLRRPDLLGDE